MEVGFIHSWSEEVGLRCALVRRRTEIVSSGGIPLDIISFSRRVISEMWVCRGLENIDPPEGFELCYTFVEVVRHDGVCTPLPHYYYKGVIDGIVWIIDPTVGQLVDYLLSEKEGAMELQVPGDRMRVLQQLSKDTEIQFVVSSGEDGLIIMIGPKDSIATAIGILYSEFPVM